MTHFFLCALISQTKPSNNRQYSPNQRQQWEPDFNRKVARNLQRRDTPRAFFAFLACLTHAIGLHNRHRFCGQWVTSRALFSFTDVHFPTHTPHALRHQPSSHLKRSQGAWPDRIRQSRRRGTRRLPRAHPLLSLSVLKRFERRPENVIGGELRRPCLSEASASCGNKGGSLGYRFSRLLQIPLEWTMFFFFKCHS